MEIIVIRGPGDIEGPQIIDPLLSNNSVGITRGQTALNDNAGLQPVTLLTLYRSNFFTGQLIEVHDALQGTAWRAKIVGVEHRVERNEIETQLSLLRKVD